MISCNGERIVQPTETTNEQSQMFTITMGHRGLHNARSACIRAVVDQLAKPVGAVRQQTGVSLEFDTKYTGAQSATR